MTIRQTLRRATIVAATSAAVLALSGAPASAHVIVVEPSGNGETKVGWVGGPAVTHANGKGLIPGGPTGDDLLTPAHGKGLNQACEAIRAHGNGAVAIFGPPTPAGCPHGT